MKKYRYCFLLLLGAALLILILSLIFLPGARRKAEPEGEETTSFQEKERETAAEDQIVMNQKEVEPAAGREYLLVSEDGFLLVFEGGGSRICLYTHIPLSDFPREEQDKLREGIWFSAMEEIYSYLESYTS
ncbi:MAG TPA: hypothetical protein IAA51_06450 [Candidatus Cottocaccamicrobium excrementipullorum]|nr:hypothetical protein [Candidatus Cottocaccamicrobium excrementipullorum]